jgi:beta-phosphoglucomutase
MRTLLLLDLDGTLIDTPHYEAWRYAARRIGIEDLTYEEYVIYIAGRPRLDGASRLMELKKNCARVDTRWLHDLAEIKQLEFLRLSVNTRLFGDALRLLERVETSRQRVRFYTASQNAPGLFDAALRRSGKSLSRQTVVQQRRDQTRGELFLYLADEHASDAVTLIDDAPHAVDVACSLGIRAYQIRRNEFQAMATDPRACVLPSLDAITVPIGDTVKEEK